CVRSNYFFEFFVELNNLEFSFFAFLQHITIFFFKVTVWTESNDIVIEFYSSSFVNYVINHSGVFGTNCKFIFVFIPRIFCRLLVTKAQFTSFNIKLKNYNIKLFSNAGEFARMLNFLSPRKVADVDQSVDSFFKFYKHSKVGKVANDTFMT